MKYSAPLKHPLAWPQSKLSLLKDCEYTLMVRMLKLIVERPQKGAKRSGGIPQEGFPVASEAVSISQSSTLLPLETQQISSHT